MISIVVCHRNNKLLEQLKQNVVETIGIIFEFVIIDNSNNTLSIFQAYNQGIKQSKGDIICFAHEDIIFHTQDWGIKVDEHFQNPDVGIIGVLGTHFMPKCPSYWFFSNMITENFIQNKLVDGKIIQHIVKHQEYIKNEKSIEAVAVDGLWFCIPRKIFDYIKFDSLNFKGFHGYDMDICFQIREIRKQVRIISDIIIEHKNYNGIVAGNSWVESLKVLNEKWKYSLPQFAGINITKEEIVIRESYLEKYYELVINYYNAIKEVERLSHSKAYCIGKIILKPFSYIRANFFGK